MNMKKIGLTALAASLVSVSAANAGSMSISGAASVGIGGYSGEEQNAGKKAIHGQVSVRTWYGGDAVRVLCQVCLGLSLVASCCVLSIQAADAPCGSKANGGSQRRQHDLLKIRCKSFSTPVLGLDLIPLIDCGDGLPSNHIPNLWLDPHSERP